MARRTVGGGDVISRCLRSRRQDRREDEDVVPVVVRGVVGELGPTDFRLLHKIGSGGFGCVSAALHLPSATHLAVRETHLDRLTGGDSSSALAALSCEIRLCRLLRHPGVVTVAAAFIADDAVWTVMELATHGSARDLLNSFYPCGLPELVVGAVLLQLLCAVDYLHRRAGVVHRDIAAHHLLLTLGGAGRLGATVKLAGFRHALSCVHAGRRLRKIHEFPPHSASALNWLAPEVLEQNVRGYNAKSDMYSLGVTACELANGEVPFQRMATTQVLYNKLTENNVPYPFDSTHPPPEDLLQDSTSDGSASSSRQLWLRRRFTPALHSFVAASITHDQNRRPSAAALLGHVLAKGARKAAASGGDPLLSLLKSLPPVTDSNAANDPASASAAPPTRAPGLHRAPIVRSESDLSSVWDFDV